MFTAVLREKCGFDSFVGCRICGDLRCEACAGVSGICPACEEPWQENTYPQVWLHRRRSTLWSNSWGLACRSPTRSTHGRPDPAREPDARWYACGSCAAEFCEPCARERAERCWCRATVALRAVPPWAAYLPDSVRELHANLTEQEQAADLQQRRAAIVAEWDRGVLNKIEVEGRVGAIDGALSDLGVEPGPRPWEAGVDPGWFALEQARCRPGPDITERLRTPPWESTDPQIVAAWEAITAPDKLQRLEERLRLDLNPTAQKATEMALEECLRRRGDCRG